MPFPLVGVLCARAVVRVRQPAAARHGDARRAFA